MGAHDRSLESVSRPYFEQQPPPFGGEEDLSVKRHSLSMGLVSLLPFFRVWVVHGMVSPAGFPSFTSGFPCYLVTTLFFPLHPQGCAAFTGWLTMQWLGLGISLLSSWFIQG